MPTRVPPILISFVEIDEKGARVVGQRRWLVVPDAGDHVRLAGVLFEVDRRTFGVETPDDSAKGLQVVDVFVSRAA